MEIILENVLIFSLFLLLYTVYSIRFTLHTNRCVQIRHVAHIQFRRKNIFVLLLKIFLVRFISTFNTWHLDSRKTKTIKIHSAIVTLKKYVEEEGVDESTKEWIAASEKLKEVTA